jgi:hypothetical protein
MADDHDERFRRHAEMRRALLRLWSAQHDLPQCVTLAIERIDQKGVTAYD